MGDSEGDDCVHEDDRYTPLPKPRPRCQDGKMCRVIAKPHRGIGKIPQAIAKAATQVAAINDPNKSTVRMIAKKHR